MAKKIPMHKPCDHDVAQWARLGGEHVLRCCRCQHALDREPARTPRTLGVVLFRDVRDGGYAPFNPKGCV
jgi:hypothetical protein